MRHAPTTGRTLAAYDRYIEGERRARLREGAAALADARVAHVNSTASGGGVAEMLASLVPLADDAGVDTDWLVIEADETFFEVTKAIHNGLQGGRTELTDGMIETYRRVTAANADALEGGYDAVVLHDPQTLGMIEPLSDRLTGTTFVWRCHVDPTDATEPYLEFLRPYLEQVDRAVFSRAAYGDALAGEGVARTVVHPAVDPLTEKNRPIGELSGEAAAAAEPGAFPFDPDRPLIAQVSRFDPWKDPLGVVEVGRRVREAVPDAQLALVGGMPDDDPEGERIYRAVADETADDPDVHLLTDLPDAGVNAVQRAADVVVQKSLREGFALTVSEALWKRTPVVGADVGGIPLQIEDGVNGYLVDPEDVPGAADRVARLLTDDALARELGERGRGTVRDRFLLPRLLADYLDLLAAATGRDGAGSGE